MALVCVCVCEWLCVRMHACVRVMVCVYSMSRRDQNRTFNQRFSLKKLCLFQIKLLQLISLVMTSELQQTTAPVHRLSMSQAMPL